MILVVLIHLDFFYHWGCVDFRQFFFFSFFFAWRLLGEFFENCYDTNYNTRTILFTYQKQDGLHQNEVNACDCKMGSSKKIRICKRWIQLTGLHPCITPNSDHVMNHLRDYNCSVRTSPHRISCMTNCSCNLPNDSSHGLNWVATRMSTR